MVMVVVVVEVILLNEKGDDSNSSKLRFRKCLLHEMVVLQFLVNILTFF